MAQNVSKVPVSETNNYKRGRSGSGTMKKPGPAKGNRGKMNPTKGGGIYRTPKSN